jgi:hypothetical protein
MGFFPAWGARPAHGCVTVALTRRHGRMTPWVYVVLSARRKIWFIMIKNTTQFFHIGLALVSPLATLFDSVVYAMNHTCRGIFLYMNTVFSTASRATYVSCEGMTYLHFYTDSL